MTKDKDDAQTKSEQAIDSMADAMLDGVGVGKEKSQTYGRSGSYPSTTERQTRSNSYDRTGYDSGSYGRQGGWNGHTSRPMYDDYETPWMKRQRMPRVLLASRHTEEVSPNLACRQIALKLMDYLETNHSILFATGRGALTFQDVAKEVFAPAMRTFMDRLVEENIMTIPDDGAVEEEEKPKGKALMDSLAEDALAEAKAQGEAEAEGEGEAESEERAADDGPQYEE